MIIFIVTDDLVEFEKELVVGQEIRKITSHLGGM